MDLIDKLELYSRFPGSLAARLTERLGGSTILSSAEDQIGTFVQDVTEDEIFVWDGELRASDGSTYTIVWHPAPRSEWVEWDQVVHERSL